MTHDDIDTPEEFEQAAPAKPSLKEAWESNPMLKLAAVVLVGAVFVGGFLIFTSETEEGVKSRMKISASKGAKQVPGQHELDPVYRKALEDVNKQEAKAAVQSGGSAIPVPIATSKTGGIDLPYQPEKDKSDVLAEWRKATETSRMKAVKEAIDEDQAVPEVVPTMQPIRPAAAMLKQDPAVAKSLASQMRVIIGAQGPLKSSNILITKEESLYAAQEREAKEAKEEEAKAAGSSAAGGATSPEGGAAVKDPVKTIVPAGSIAYASLLTELNSDIQGPVLAQILSGPFEGGRAIGKVSVKEEYMVITFKTVVKDAVSYKVEGIALDENTTLAGQATDVDHHYFKRVVLPAAAKFVSGYGKAISETGSTVVATAGGGTETETPKPTAKESLYKGLAESTDAVSEFLEKGADVPITVKIAKGTTMGVLFLETVTTKDATK